MRCLTITIILSASCATMAAPVLELIPLIADVALPVINPIVNSIVGGKKPDDKDEIEKFGLNGVKAGLEEVNNLKEKLGAEIKEVADLSKELNPKADFGKLRAFKEAGLEKLRNVKEAGLEKLRDLKEAGLEKLRDVKEAGLEKLRGFKKAGLKKLRDFKEKVRDTLGGENKEDAIFFLGAENKEGAKGTEEKECAKGTEKKESANGAEKKEDAKGAEKKEDAKGAEKKEDAEGAEKKEGAKGAEKKESGMPAEKKEGAEKKDCAKGAEKKESGMPAEKKESAMLAKKKEGAMPENKEYESAGVGKAFGNTSDGKDGASAKTSAKGVDGESDDTKDKSEGTPGETETAVIVSADGLSPTELTIAPGGKIAFSVTGEGKYTVTEGDSSKPCSPLAGGSNSKSLGKGETWSYTVPQEASGKIYFYSGNDDQCKSKMWATVNVVDNLVATTSEPSTNLFSESSAGSTTPVFATIGALAFVGALGLL